MIRLSVWFESLKWRISNGRRHTLNWWYLVLAGVLIVWLGVAEAVALPAYGGYAHEVFSNLLAGVPSTPPAAVQVTVFPVVVFGGLAGVGISAVGPPPVQMDDCADGVQPAVYAICGLSNA
mgnify:CR=1 FL=1